MRYALYGCIAALPLLLTACQDGMGPLGIDKDKIFADLPGPDVDGLEATYLKNAKAMEGQGEYNKAVQLYRQLLEIDKENTEYLLAFASNLRRIGEIDRAERIYSKVLEIEPENLDAKEGKGLLKLYRGEFEKAGETLSKVYALDGTRWRTLNGLAIIFVEREMYKEAVAYFKEAIDHSENNVSVLNNVGLTHAINDDPEKAIAALTKAIEFSPAGSPTKQNVELNLAMVMGIYGDTDVAEKILSEHLPDAAVANNLGLYAYLSKEETLAKSYLNMALSKSPYHYKRAWDNLLTITENSEGQKKTRRKKGKVVKVPQ